MFFAMNYCNFVACSCHTHANKYQH